MFAKEIDSNHWQIVFELEGEANRLDDMLGVCLPIDDTVGVPIDLVLDDEVAVRFRRLVDQTWNGRTLTEEELST